jgi:hypothetical protein
MCATPTIGFDARDMRKASRAAVGQGVQDSVRARGAETPFIIQAFFKCLFMVCHAVI